MADALSRISTKHTPQGEQADPREVPNAAGGYVFQVPDTAHLHRFLTLGTTGGTFYTSESRLTREATALPISMAKGSDPRLIEKVREIGVSGRAPRHDPALFALAAAAKLGGETSYRQEALGMLPEIARTGYHLFKFVGYAEQFGGWGTAFKNAVADWYTGKPIQDAAFQMLKYKERGGWSQRDILRLAHLRNKRHGADIGSVQNDLFRYFARGEAAPSRNLMITIPLVEAAYRAHQTRNVREWVEIISSNRSLSWEMLPSEALNEADVLAALLLNGNMPIGAMLRELPRLTRAGVLAPMSETLKFVNDHLTAEHVLARGRVHPMAMLIAAKTYASGHSTDGKSTWRPVQQVVDALNDGFYAAFGAVEPSGKRVMITTDTSGSMGWAIPGYPMTAAETVGAMAMVTARTEPVYSLHGFNSQIYDLPISPRMRLDTVLKAMFDSYGGSTDCAAPMVWARRNKVPVDTFQIYTDNETWAGSVHPWEALENYRQQSGIDARLQVVSVRATTHTIADPADPRQIDISGFDASVAKLLADHGRGDL